LLIAKLDLLINTFVYLQAAISADLSNYFIITFSITCQY